MSGKDLLLSALVTSKVTPVEIKEIPELDGKIFVRVLTAGERHLYGSVAEDARKEGGSISDYEIVAICACEADGTPMFHTRDEDGRINLSSDDVAKLRDIDGRAVHAIALKALSVSGMLVGAKELVKKNSSTIQSDESSSD